MDCLKCGTDIGNSVGICASCRDQSSGELSEDRKKQFELLRERRRQSTVRELWLWLTADTQRVLNLFGLTLGLGFVYFIVSGSGCSSVSPASFRRPAGIVVAEEPLQTEARGEPWQKDGWTFNALAGFTIRARVLVAARFAVGAGSDISPFDFTLGWGPMSDTAVLRQLSFSHGFRFAFWSPADGEHWPMHPDDLNRHASNLHAIPASPEVLQMLKRIAVDDVVTFDGLLVRTTDGTRFWNSSVNRTDSGAGACEVMWIESVKIEP